MATDTLERIREEENERRIPALLAWLDCPELAKAKEMWMLSHRFPEHAALVVRAFGEGEDFAQEFAELTIYRKGWPPENDGYWRVVGRTLKWLLKKDDCPAYNGMTRSFLTQLEGFREKLTSDEAQIWGELLVESLWRWDLNFLSDHGIVEAIPALERKILEVRGGRRLTTCDALINGREPKAMYNLLRLRAIRAVRRRKEREGRKVT